MAQRVTMKMIAEACSVSRNAVSLALAGKKGVSAKTSEQIRQTAISMGYVLDPELSRIGRRLGRVGKEEGIRAEIPFLVPLVDGQDPEGTLFFMKMCSDHARRCNYHVVPYFTGPGHYSVKRVQEIWKARGINGVLLFNPNDLDWEHTEEFDWENYSWVTFSETMQRPLLHRLNWNFRSAITTCFDKLLVAGFQRIGLVMQERYDEIIGHAGMAAHTLHQDRVSSYERVPWLRHRYRIHTEEGKHELAAWLRKEKPDAIVGHRECLESLCQLGYDIPGDVAFADWRLHEGAQGKVAGIMPAFEMMGRVAVDMLISQMEHSFRGIPEYPTVTYIPGKWEDGETLPR